jgi:hypothetical protein
MPKQIVGLSIDLHASPDAQTLFNFIRGKPEDFQSFRDAVLDFANESLGPPFNGAVRPARWRHLATGWQYDVDWHWYPQDAKLADVIKVQVTDIRRHR